MQWHECAAPVGRSANGEPLRSGLIASIEAACAAPDRRRPTSPATFHPCVIAVTASTRRKAKNTNLGSGSLLQTTGCEAISNDRRVR
jgi:hypothetical protein